MPVLILVKISTQLDISPSNIAALLAHSVDFFIILHIFPLVPQSETLWPKSLTFIIARVRWGLGYSFFAKRRQRQKSHLDKGGILHQLGVHLFHQCRVAFQRRQHLHHLQEHNERKQPEHTSQGNKTQTTSGVRNNIERRNIYQV